jgi:hypothetical protein
MSVNLSAISPYLWIVGVTLVAIVAFVIIRFFWHHVLRYLVQGCLVIVGLILLLAVLHFFKIF